VIGFVLLGISAATSPPERRPSLDWRSGAWVWPYVGNPAEEIIGAGDESGADLILIGSTGAGRAVRFLMGSASDRVVRHANRPVLVVR